MEPQRTIWMHVHVPKTAGMSFVDIMRNNFGASFLRSGSPLDNYHWTPDYIAQLLRVHPHLRCLSDHKISTELPYDDPAWSIRGIFWIRNPAKWLCSGYFFNRLERDEHYNPKSKELDLEAWCKDRKAFYQSQRDLFYCQATRGTGLTDPDEACQRIHEHQQSGRIVVLPTERFDDAAIWLERTYPEDFSDCSYVFRNRSRRDQQVSEQLLKDMIEMMPEDAQFHEQQSRAFDESFKSLFADESEMNEAREDFRRRCQRRKRKDFFKRAVHEFCPPIVGKVTKKLFR